MGIISYYTPHERSPGGYIGITLSVRLSICLSVCLSVQICVLPIHFFVWHWLTIFGICVNHHETMCRVHSWSRFDLELWLKFKFIEFLTCFCVRPLTIFLFDVGLQYLAQGSYTMRRCDTYIHVPNSMLTFVLIQIYRLSSCLHIPPVSCVNFDIGIP